MLTKEMCFGRIDGMNFVRMMGALGIVIFHFVCHCRILPDCLYQTANCPWGQLWVALFFAVSGTCIARSNAATPVWTFYKKRWLGIFPVFFIAYIMIFAIKLLVYGVWWTAIPKATIPLTLLGVDSYFYYLGPNFSSVGEWFIGGLLLCYLLYPLLRFFIQRIPMTILSVLILGCFFIPYLPFFEVEPWRNMWTCTTIFYLGMLLAQFPKVFTSMLSFIIAGASTAVCLFVPFPLREYVPLSQILYPIISGISTFVLLCHVGVYIDRIRIGQQIAAYFSKLSYPIFLLQHVVIIMVLDKLNPTSPVVAWGILVIDMILTIIFADIIQMYFERLCNYLRVFK